MTKSVIIPRWVLSTTKPSEESLLLYRAWKMDAEMQNCVPVGHVGPVLVVAILGESADGFQWHPCIQPVVVGVEQFQEIRQQCQEWASKENIAHRGMSLTEICMPARSAREEDWRCFWSQTIDIIERIQRIRVERSQESETLFLSHIIRRIPVVDLSRVAVMSDPAGMGTFLARNDAIRVCSNDEINWIAVSEVPDPLFEDRLRNRLDGRMFALVLAERDQIQEARRNLEHGVTLAGVSGKEETEDTVWVLQREDGEQERIRQEKPSVEDYWRYMLARSLLLRVSDIHIEEKGIRIRKDGALIPLLSLNEAMQRSLVSVIKGMAGMDQANFFTRQDGAFNLRMEKVQVNVRASAIPIRNHLRHQATQKIVLRLLPRENTTEGSLEDLGFSSVQMAMLRHAMNRPQGLILITGPTGSGKTTTIYGLLRELVTRNHNILTFEDPIEYELEQVNQTQMDPLRGLTIQEFRKGYVRQDPDILFLGEIRDPDTAKFALESSLTGHLVLSTLHTESASGAIHRLIALGVHTEILSRSLLLLQAQRLVRRLCPVCKRKRPSSEIFAEQGGRLVSKSQCQIPDYLYEAVGCSGCQNTGYNGRVVLMEMIPVTHRVAQAIATTRMEDLFGVDRVARESGFSTLYEDAWRRACMGDISVSQAALYGNSWEEYEDGSRET